MDKEAAEKKAARQQRKEEFLNSVRDKMGVRQQREEFKERIRQKQNKKK